MHKKTRKTKLAYSLKSPIENLNKKGRTKTAIPIAKLPNENEVSLSVIIHNSGKPGPTILFSAGMHGDEINGVEIVRNIDHLLTNEYQLTKGKIILLPIINPFGFINFSRYLPDGKDLNRSFPGSKNGSLASIIAFILTNTILPHIDFGIDFHTGGEQKFNYPHLRIDLNDKKALEIAKITETNTIIHSTYIAKSFRKISAQKNKPILVFEGGESNRIDNAVIDTGITVALNLMSNLELIKDIYIHTSNQKIYKHSSWLRAKSAGIFKSVVKVGELVTKKQTIGFISSPLNAYNIPIITPHEGIVFGINNSAIVYKGEALFHLAFN
tara:strand:- start:43845 stop:44822 length:978 start_codon:yes stop_codon:yes gene_type:complete